MGLAASQARLLTITARKSDCEFQSMAYSHQKIALSRDMSVVSEEYQDALSQTKLVYDYYGTGDTSTELSYSLLTSPSALNDYLPTLITDQSGRVVLDSSLAAAASAAGIPQEGLGSTPSSDIRNKFIQGLVDEGVISESIGASIKSITYDPELGLGGDYDTIDYTTTTVTWDVFVDAYLSDVEIDFYDIIEDYLDYAGEDEGAEMILYKYNNETNKYEEVEDRTDYVVSLADIINGDYVLVGVSADLGKDYEYYALEGLANSDFWTYLFESLSDYINPDDSYAQAAVSYAQEQITAMIESLTDPDEADIDNWGDYTCVDCSNSAYHKDYSSGTGVKTAKSDALKTADDYVGYVYFGNTGKKNNSSFGISLSNIAQAYYTYFAAYMEGLATTDYEVNSEYDTCNMIDYDFAFEIIEDADTSGDNLLYAQFYDTLFNQIAINGWVENDNVNDNDYLQTMLQNGSMYLSTLEDDNYYYQSNYATNTYINEITDEDGIAEAEATYEVEQNKIETKENILDMKMNNLDTEISALTTEYDTVQSVISKNIEKTFTRYDA